MSNSLLSTEILKIFIFKFTTVITSNSFNFERMLFFLLIRLEKGRSFENRILNFVKTLLLELGSSILTLLIALEKGPEICQKTCPRNMHFCTLRGGFDEWKDRDLLMFAF